jgi:hypothetical protein
MTIELVPNKPDKELAADLKAELIDAFEPLLKILDKAKASGFNCNFQIGLNAFGKMHIASMHLFKNF